MNAKASFTSIQRRQLARYGLVPEQIEELQNGVLPYLRAMLSRYPTTTELRARMREIEAPLTKALRALKSLEASQVSGTWEIYDRLREASVDAEFLPKAVNDVTRIAEAFSKALRSMAGQQRRSHQASIQPIAWIDRKLLDGFIRHHKPGWPDQHSDHALPHYLLRVSCSDPFAGIVRVCYEAAGMPDPNPERAIRKYLSVVTARDNRARELAGFGPEHITRPKRGRPPKR